MQPPIASSLPARPVSTAEVGWLERHPQITRAVAFLGCKPTPHDEVVGLVVQAGEKAHLVGYSQEDQTWERRERLTPKRSTQVAYEQVTQSVYEWVRAHNPERTFAVLHSVRPA